MNTKNMKKFEIHDLGMVFIPILPGSFLMGSDDEEPCEKPEKPVHRVTLSKGFWLAKTVVTQDQWRSVMGDSPSRFKGDDLPVEMVEWNRCMEFCAKLTEREREAGRIPTGFEYRLPTEAEWEYAAQGGEKSRGCEYSGGNDLEAVAWYDKNSGGKTHPVGQKQPNELGLHDMSGNVWEWCQDVWHYTYNGAPSDGSAWEGDGSYRVFRGGGWFNDASYCRSAYRSRGGPSVASSDLGFRVAFSAVPEVDATVSNTQKPHVGKIIHRGYEVDGVIYDQTGIGGRAITDFEKEIGKMQTCLNRMRGNLNLWKKFNDKGWK